MQDQRALELAMAASNLSLRSPTLENFILNNPLPTPPAPSPHNEDLSAETETVVSVSTAFHPTSYPDLPVPDTIFQASDGVLFYAHSNTILSACSSAFRDFIGSPLEDPKYRDNIIPVASTSSEFNVIMHMLYGSSCAPHSPSFENLVNAVDRMPAYSIPPDNHILVATPLYSLLLSHAPINPLDLYALAAFHNIHPLAVATSSHLLSYSLQTISDSQADRMGAMYLKRLMMLHVERFTALKTILLKPPHPHAPTRKCGFIEQRKLTRAWALVSAHLAWDARAGKYSSSEKNILGWRHFRHVNKHDVRCPQSTPRTTWMRRLQTIPSGSDQRPYCPVDFRYCTSTFLKLVCRRAY